MPEHFVAVPHAAVLATPTFQLVDRDLADLIGHQAMGVVHGEAGLGKSFAVDAALEGLPGYAHGQVSARMRVVKLVFPHAPTTLRVAQELAAALLEIPVARSRSRFQLQEQVLDELSGRPYLLVVDEAQRLTRHAMEVLRYFYDSPATQLVLLLVGGNGCWETISREPMLASRIYRRRRFRPLPGRRVPALMRTYHPLYAEADEQLLAEVDATFAHGYWRNWAAFTATAYDLVSAVGRSTLDAELVANIYTSLGHDDPDP
ncbi:ATP-binding protein [Haloactinomyces albus]|uniref:ORC1/DEAH AAA+ ATPase domain-containing protein n=1 Tax=Haloactinomyces albus TaxID=1352928 RepID=A0AAE4CPJ5_9ACTN|nr:ATP-binding protein [Haloactinomyces albus]MDR7304496.1 hypothetical protein [Haloactinomyces albus]